MCFLFGFRACSPRVVSSTKSWKVPPSERFTPCSFDGRQHRAFFASLARSSSPLEQKLAHDRFAALYPGDQNAAKSAFLAFAGMLGQVRYRAQRFRTAGLWVDLVWTRGSSGRPLGARKLKRASELVVLPPLMTCVVGAPDCMMYVCTYAVVQRSPPSFLFSLCAVQVTNTIAFGFSLLGTSVVIRRLGLRLTLLTYPLMCLAVAVTMMVHPRLYVSLVCSDAAGGKDPSSTQRVVVVDSCFSAE